ncbi:uncharacterized protein [Malus domestica]|uniref:uncharacterized protein isoform X2 n=1 Tax=Malus domestica TaxID=3750 RepID=UPI00397668EC
MPPSAPKFLFCPTDSSPPSKSNRRVSRQISCRTMPPSSDPAVPTVTPVTISYSELQDKDKDLSVKIEEGFGPNGLGILSITRIR